jgi:hypothetical protein
MDLREIGWGSVEWIEFTQDRDRWRALVNTVMNLQVQAPWIEVISDLVSIFIFPSFSLFILSLISSVFCNLHYWSPVKLYNGCFFPSLHARPVTIFPQYPLI